ISRSSSTTMTVLPMPSVRKSTQVPDRPDGVVDLVESHIDVDIDIGGEAVEVQLEPRLVLVLPGHFDVTRQGDAINDGPAAHVDMPPDLVVADLLEPQGRESGRAGTGEVQRGLVRPATERHFEPDPGVVIVDGLDVRPLGEHRGNQHALAPQEQVRALVDLVAHLDPPSGT